MSATPLVVTPENLRKFNAPKCSSRLIGEELSEGDDVLVKRKRLTLANSPKSDFT